MILKDARVLVVGVGGLGCPAAQVLASSGVGHLVLLDDDRVSVSNLHRQILFDDSDVGSFKSDVAADKLTALGSACVSRRERLLPENASALLEGVDLVVEGSDNLATKFLAADAARLSGVPIVHAGAVRWGGWAFASGAEHRASEPCLRCLFEDLPPSPVDSCEFAGVVGPVVGALGCLQALLALRSLAAEDVAGTLYHLDGLRPSLRHSRINARPDCPHALGLIHNLERSRYLSESTA